MNPIDQIRKALEAIKAAKAQKHAGLTLTAAQAEAILASHDAAVQRAAEMQALNAKLVEALSFYANPGDYKAPFTGGQGKLYFDCGQTACNAMAENAIVRAAAIRAIKE